MFNRNTIFSLVMIALAAGAYFKVDGLGVESKLFPQVVSLILITLNCIHLVKHIFFKPDKGVFHGVHPGNLLAMVLGIVVYVLIIGYIGFVAASIIFLSFFMWFFHRSEHRGVKVMAGCILISASVTLVFYGVFQQLFLIPLPKGIWFGG